MRHDAIIIGGSFAGLSAAMYIARARRSVSIGDTGSPRNRHAPHSHPRQSKHYKAKAPSCVRSNSPMGYRRLFPLMISNLEPVS